jgi:DNA topoisomerase-1
MKVAQKLYETGYITYMRTDSVAMSEEATKEAKTEVIKQYGENYLGTIIQKSKSDNKTQDAHECIRPTRFSTITLDQTFSVLEKNIYNLIPTPYLYYYLHIPDIPWQNTQLFYKFALQLR